MCDPMIMGVASMVSGIANAVGESSALEKQQQAYDDWILLQRKNRTEQQAKDEALRAQETTAQQQGLAQISASGQKKQQDAETARLLAYYQGQGPASTESHPGADPGAPLAVTDVTHGLSGQGLIADSTFQNDLNTKMTQAREDAKNRMAALARVSATGGSQYGGDVNFAVNTAQTGTVQDYLNNLRKGNLAVYNVKQQQDPEHFRYDPGPTIG